MTKIRTCIIEDEIGARNTLIKIIESYIPDLSILGFAGDVQSSIDLIHSHKPELVFMDITLSDGTGFDVLEQTKAIPYELIFVTAHSEYYEMAFDFLTLNYLLKPISINKLEATIAKYKFKRKNLYKSEKSKDLRMLLEEKSKKILLPVKDGYCVENTDNILKLEADGNYTRIITLSQDKYLCSKSLAYFEEVLDSQTFFRVHKSHIVNIDHIKKINKEGSIELKDKSIISLSRRIKSKFFNFLKSQH